MVSVTAPPLHYPVLAERFDDSNIFALHFPNHGFIPQNLQTETGDTDAVEVIVADFHNVLGREIKLEKTFGKK